MTKEEKEAQQAQLEAEKKVIRELRQVYERARKDCEEKIRELGARTDVQNLQSIIYQKQYQQALKKQLDGICDILNSSQFTTIGDYLVESYYNGYIGTMYDIAAQGIPLTVPIKQEDVTRAIQVNSKIKGSLYESLGEDVKRLKNSIRAELSRGISNGSSYEEIAAKIARGMNSPFNKVYNNALRIAKTEGHRVQQEGTYNAQVAAKKKGADVVKQWDSTLDGKTRPTHRELDGQIAEVEDMFVVPSTGNEALYPGGFGIAAEDINCRCCSLQRAKWALDMDELVTLAERATYFGIDKSQELAEFKKKYLNIPPDDDTIDLKNFTKKLQAAMNPQDYDEFINMLQNHPNEAVRRLYEHADDISGVKYEPIRGGGYRPSTNSMTYSYPKQKYISEGMSKYDTLAHEYGHFFDHKMKYGQAVHFNEIETVRNTLRYPNNYKKMASSSDEFLSALRMDEAQLKKKLTGELLSRLRNDNLSNSVQDGLDGLFGLRDKRKVNWGHGDAYYNHMYNASKSLGDHKALQNAYKAMGFDASNQDKTRAIVRNYETASELWANLISAEVCGGDTLEYMKEYFPHSYETMKMIIEEVE